MQSKPTNKEEDSLDYEINLFSDEDIIDSNKNLTPEEILLLNNQKIKNYTNQIKNKNLKDFPKKDKKLVMTAMRSIYGFVIETINPMEAASAFNQVTLSAPLLNNMRKITQNVYIHGDKYTPNIFKGNANYITHQAKVDLLLLKNKVNGFIIDVDQINHNLSIVDNKLKGKPAYSKIDINVIDAYKLMLDKKLVICIDKEDKVNLKNILIKENYDLENLDFVFINKKFTNKVDSLVVDKRGLSVGNNTLIYLYNKQKNIFKKLKEKNNKAKRIRQKEILNLKPNKSKYIPIIQSIETIRELELLLYYTKKENDLMCLKDALIVEIEKRNKEEAATSAELISSVDIGLEDEFIDTFDLNNLDPIPPLDINTDLELEELNMEEYEIPDMKLEEKKEIISEKTIIIEKREDKIKELNKEIELKDKTIQHAVDVINLEEEYKNTIISLNSEIITLKNNIKELTPTIKDKTEIIFIYNKKDKAAYAEALTELYDNHCTKKYKIICLPFAKKEKSKKTLSAILMQLQSKRGAIIAIIGTKTYKSFNKKKNQKLFLKLKKENELYTGISYKNYHLISIGSKHYINPRLVSKNIINVEEEEENLW